MHKYLKGEQHQLMNLVNYMSNFTNETTFKGFVPLENEEYFGIDIDGVQYAAIHLFNEPYTKARSDEQFKEEQYLAKGYNTLLVIYGSDNTSYMKRFKDKKSAEKWIQKTEELVRDDSWLWYNS